MIPACCETANMKTTIKSNRAFTLVEMLVVISVIGILSALLLPALSASKATAKRMTCLNNLKQINYAVRMYYDDSNDASPPGYGPRGSPLVGYKGRVKNYLGLNGRSSPQDKIFACPADMFHYYYPSNRGCTLTNAPLHDDERYDYSSYWYNGMNLPAVFSVPRLGIAGLKLTSIKEPAKTVLVAEEPAFYPYSWHEPKLNEGLMFNDAKDMVSFVDGHVIYIKIYWFEPSGFMACCTNPPAGYDYKWSGD
jgi:prepilin-type N-terminal cleavage/methylation domain-containing protein